MAVNKKEKSSGAQYVVVAINNKTGKEVIVSDPDTRERSETMAGKFSHHPLRRIEVRQVRASNPRAPSPNETNVTELYFHAINSSKLLKRADAFIENAAKKMKAGKYDAAKGATLFAYLAKEAAADYAKEYGGSPSMFSPADRLAAGARLEEYYRLHASDRAAELAAPKGRGKNPASVHNKTKGRERVILKLLGHPKGAGYWTGTGWDTKRTVARIITAANLDTVVKMAEKLAKGMPATYRIEIHPAGK